MLDFWGVFHTLDMFFRNNQPEMIFVPPPKQKKNSETPDTSDEKELLIAIGSFQTGGHNQLRWSW